MSHFAQKIAWSDGLKNYSMDGKEIGEQPAPLLNHIGYLYRCCDDPRTDSWAWQRDPHRLDADPGFFSRHQSKVQNTHAAKLAAIAHIETEISFGKARASDLAGVDHDVEIVGYEHWTDEVVKVHYQCCAVHRHIQFIEDLFSKRKQASDIGAEMVKHRAEAARHHANVLKLESIKAQIKSTPEVTL
jgi:hypothetical protein